MATLVLLTSMHLIGFSQEEEESDKPEAFDTSEFIVNEGFFTFLWDNKEGEIWLDVSQPAAENDGSFLYVTSLATGLGSNPVGLDRGQLGETRIVHFRRVGNKVYLIQENWRFRASTTNLQEKTAIRDSFAESVLWTAEVKNTSDGKQVVKLNSLLIRDAHDCSIALERAGQGKYSFDKERSFVHLPRCKAFPKNTEFEAAITLTSSEPGRLAQRVAAEGQAITLRQHHSFIQLPDAGYKPRKWDPRAGSFSVVYSDYGVTIDEPLEHRFVARHRLQKADSESASSEPLEPIVYFVDPGVPEPVRTALVDGASWWNAAFESAGFKNAFQVKILPDDADPMDVRFNVIQWVHRATRGWSYGQTITDPRTGEIIKGHVLLGSLRVRQDHLLFQGLSSNLTQGLGSALSSHPPYPNSRSLWAPNSLSHPLTSCNFGFAPDAFHLSQLADDAISSTEVALARIRQLSAHEVGHTIGFTHNFAASTYADRASVMDYPAPRVGIRDGNLDLSDAYGIGIGAWDKFAVQYSYSEFAENEEEQLESLVSDAISQGLIYITDADARPAGAAHPLGSLWDNGSDPVEALDHTMNVRKIAMQKFNRSTLRQGAALSELEKIFVPVYLHHRYQVDATAKSIGGFKYTYAIHGDSQVPIEMVALDRQRAALHSLLMTLEPSALTVPGSVLNSLPPRPTSSISDQERFDSHMSPVFDPATAMQTAAELTIGNLLQPQRVSRVVNPVFVSQDDWDQRLTLREIVSGIRTIASVEDSREPQEYLASRVIKKVLVDKLIALAESSGASADAQAAAFTELKRLQLDFDKARHSSSNDPMEPAHNQLLNAQISRFLSRSYPEASPAKPTELPPGSPIGHGR